MERALPQIVPVDPAAPRAAAIEAAVRVLLEGGVVALPTETFYGLAVDAADAAAVARVRRAKQLDDDAPLLLLAADRDQAAALASALPACFDALAARFWPGPLTVVLPYAAREGGPVCGATGSVAVRVPGLGVARRLAEALGRPLTGTSANRHGAPPSRTAAAVLDAMGEELAMILDGGASAGGAPSTIVDLTVDPPRVLREGLLPVASIRRFVELGPSGL